MFKLRRSNCALFGCFSSNEFSNCFSAFGPMLDIKNTLMLIEDFKGKFVIRLTATIVVICLLAALLVHLAWGVML